MAVFAITTEQSISQLTGKSGDDTYNINAGTLVIDTDSRYGLNQNQNSALGNITVSTTLGGEFKITSRNIRLIPFNTGGGGVPPAGTLITQGTAFGELICVMTTKTGGDVITSSMPNSGWIKIKLIQGSFTSGALSGLSANATAPDEKGWMVVVGVEPRVFNIPRLGKMTIDGDWFNIGITSGIRGQTVQLPFYNAEVRTYYPGVEIETAPNSGVYKFWANAGTKFTSSNMSLDSRCMYLHISTSGVVTIGKGTDNQPSGLLPVAGCNIRIPNIILQSCTSAAKSVNSEPNSVLGNRFESQFSSAGVLEHNCSTGTWYWNMVQAYSLNLLNLHTVDQLTIAECVQPPVIDNLHVGLSTRAAHIASYALLIQQCYSGGQIGTVSALRADSSTTSSYCTVLVNMYDNWTIQNIRAGYATDCAALAGALFVNMCDDMVIDYAATVGKRVLIFSSNNIKIKTLVYADNIKSTTSTVLGSHALESTSQSKDCEVYNIQNWADAPNTHPYSGIVYCSGNTGFKVRNTGTPDLPYDCGTVNPTGYFYSDGGNNASIKLQRNWLKNLRLGIASGTNTSTKYSIENCYNVDASKTIGTQQLNTVTRGNRNNSGSVPQSYVSVYGVHFWDSFTSDTTTRCSIVFTEKTQFTQSAYVINSGNPKFTAQGALVLQAGDSITWTWDYSILGWTALTTHAKQGTKTNNLLFEYDIDSGLGFTGVFKTLTDAALATEVINKDGFRLKVKITGIVSDITNILTSFRIDGATTLQIQNEAIYPLDQATLELTGLQVGSTVAVFKETPSLGAIPICFGTDSETSSILRYEYDNSVGFYTVRIRKAGWDVVELQFQNKLTNTIPIAQQENVDSFGSRIYKRGKGFTKSLVTFEPTLLRIDIGNGKANAEDVYDLVADFQCTDIGMRYPESVKFDGTDMLMMNSWLFRRKSVMFTSAGVDALPIVNTQIGASPDDESNGSVDFKARSVRTYSGASNELTVDSISDAVQSKLYPNFSNLETRILNPLHDATNASLQWYVLTRGTEMIGVTLDAPHDKNLPDVSIHEMQGVIPDLNFYSWNYELDMFKCDMFTRVQFFAKFTIAEMLAIRNSSDVIVQGIIERLDTQNYVDVTNALNIESINYLKQIGILTEARVLEILG